ncbi:MAG: T9SS type A sorting domain-containing protein [Candidatus Pacebacteria bacterium]|jgi:hypothetical protein|nr:T9SS type A sorting domain-containing protein [Candidatus Paceibacterota bacterium]
MKKLFLMYTMCVLLPCTARAQTNAALNANNIWIAFSSNGDLYSSSTLNFSNGMQVANQNHFSLGQLWMGGFDQGTSLHLAAQTYRQAGTDYWPGPLDTTIGSIAPAVSNQWDRVWFVRKTTIDSFRLGLFGSQIPSAVADWPGNGASAANQAKILAPFVDLNANALYEPQLGDYPRIKGDEAVYCIFNDAQTGSLHGQSGGIPFGFEIHVMAYAFSCPSDSALMNSVFVHFDIYNRTDSVYTDCHVGHFSNFNFASSIFQYAGTDSLGKYQYFADEYINSAVGIVFLDKELTGSFWFSNNVWTQTQLSLSTPGDYYEMLRNQFPDGTPLTYGGSGYGGTNQTSYCYTGNPATNTGWLDTIASDKRIVASSGPFIMQPRGKYEFDIALIYAKDYVGTTPFQSTVVLNSRVQTLRQYFQTGLSPCGNISSITDPLQVGTLHVFPNPAQDILTLAFDCLESSDLIVNIYDITGKLVKTVNQVTVPSGAQAVTLSVEDLATGLYLVELSTTTTRKVVQINVLK